MERRPTTLSPAVRRVFQVVGPLLILAGLGLWAYSFMEFERQGDAFMRGERGLPSSNIGLVFLGFAMLIAGGILSNLGYMRVMSEVAATETAGAVEVSSGAFGRGIGRGLAESGLAMGGGGTVVKVKCRACGYLESEDAKFCSQCRAAL